MEIVDDISQVVTQIKFFICNLSSLIDLVFGFDFRGS